MKKIFIEILNLKYHFKKQHFKQLLKQKKLQQFKIDLKEKLIDFMLENILIYQIIIEEKEE